jgi:hypothetical protein
VALEPYARPVDENHALLVGCLVGMILKSQDDGFDYEPEIIDDEEGNHLATFAVVAPSGYYLVHVQAVREHEMQAQLLALQARLHDPEKET